LEAGFLSGLCVLAEALTDWTCLGLSDAGLFIPLAAIEPTLDDVFSFLANFNFLVRKRAH